MELPHPLLPSLLGFWAFLTAIGVVSLFSIGMETLTERLRPHLLVGPWFLSTAKRVFLSFLPAYLMTALFSAIFGLLVALYHPTIGLLVTGVLSTLLALYPASIPYPRTKTVPLDDAITHALHTTRGRFFLENRWQGPCVITITPDPKGRPFYGVAGTGWGALSMHSFLRAAAQDLFAHLPPGAVPNPYTLTLTTPTAHEVFTHLRCNATP